MDNTFYWHDYETFGVNPSVDRPSQFAGLRTDFNLNPIGEPLVIYCQPQLDILPAPQACLITGITRTVSAWKKACPSHNLFRQSIGNCRSQKPVASVTTVFVLTMKLPATHSTATSMIPISGSGKTAIRGGMLLI